MIKYFGLDRQYIQLKDELLDATDSVLSSGSMTDGIYAQKFKDWLSIKTKAPLCHTVS